MRIKCLELTLRMACHESVKNIVKDITKLMLRLVQIDNEKNAVLALKIICDVWKLNKIYFMPEVSLWRNPRVIENLFLGLMEGLWGKNFN